MHALEALHLSHPGLVALVAGILGLCIGSFLNVCAHRIPRGLSIVTPPSSCACGVPIPFWLNVPLLGWLALRGRARCCGTPISIRYPLLELTGGAALAAAWLWLPTDSAIAASVLLPLLLLLAACDIESMLVPDAPNFLLVVSGLLLSIALPSIHDAAGHELALVDRLIATQASLLGIAVGTAATWWIRTVGTAFAGREAMGEADIILCAGIGAFSGWQGALFALFGGSVIGLCFVLPGLLRARLKGTEGPATVPFVPSLALAGALWFFRGPEWLDLWFKLGQGG